MPAMKTTLPMIRWLLWIMSGLLLGGLVHLVTIMTLPRTASRDAYARLAALVPVNGFEVLPAPSPDSSVLPFMDPAFATAVCRYDLTEGPVKLLVPVNQSYTSVTFYTNFDTAYYAINDRAAGRRSIELDLMTTKQREALPGDEDVTSADRLIVESPSLTGLIVARALSPEPSLMAAATAALRTAQCRPQ
jgi:uncharacterized membrane protein